MKISKRTTAMIAGLMVASAGCGGGGSSGTGGGSSTTGQGGAASGSTTSASATSGTGGATSSSSGTGEATSSASSTSSTGSGPCTPKTCLTLAVEAAAAAGVNDPMPDACGILSDGCANFIDCAGCDNPDRACGKGAPNDTNGQLTAGVPDLCGGGCTLQLDNNGFCPSLDPLYFCTVASPTPPASLKGPCTVLYPGAFCCH